MRKQGKWSSARKTKPVDETLRVFTKCSTRRNNCEISYKSAKSSCNSCSFAHLSEKEGILTSHIAKFQSCRSRASITYPIKLGGEGWKAGQKRTQRLYKEKESCTQKNLQPLTGVWDNNTSLILTQVKNVPIEKNACAYCQNKFPRGQLAIIPFDIVISHKERWQRWVYINRNRNTDSQPLYTASSVKKLTNRYYYIPRKRIYNRFQYFTGKLLRVNDGTTLTGSHEKIMKEQLDVFI